MEKRRVVKGQVYSVYSMDGKEHYGDFHSLKEIEDKFQVSNGMVRHSFVNCTIFKNYQVVLKEEEPTDKSAKGSKRAKAVVLYDHDGNFLQEFRSTLDAAKQLGVSQSTISAIAKKEKLTYNSKFNLRFKGVPPEDLYKGHRVLVYNEFGQRVPTLLEDGTKVYNKYNSFEEAFASVGLEYNEEDYKSGYKKVKDYYQFIREPHTNLVTVQTKYLLDSTDENKPPKMFNTLEEVGKELGVTRERIRQVIQKDKKIRDDETLPEDVRAKGYRIQGYRIIKKG